MNWPAKIVLLGAGKVAAAMGARLVETGHSIEAVWSRTSEAAHALAANLQSVGTSVYDELPTQADLYLVVVPDHAIGEVAESLAKVVSNESLVAHTSGATPAGILQPHFQRYGVFYPLQSFSPGRQVDFSKVPLCVDSSLEADLPRLQKLALTLSEKVFQVSDEQRLQLHLAAVFVNNFTNYIQFIGQELVQEHDLPGELLLPLLQETIDKLHTLSPSEAQTGPALRHDQSTIDRHLALLQNYPHWQRLYLLLTEGIQKDLS